MVEKRGDDATVVFLVMWYKCLWLAQTGKQWDVLACSTGYQYEVFVGSQNLSSALTSAFDSCFWFLNSYKPSQHRGPVFSPIQERGALERLELKPLI
jgi:hypothetical protein